MEGYHMTAAPIHLTTPCASMNVNLTRPKEQPC